MDYMNIVLQFYGCIPAKRELCADSMGEKHDEP